MLADLQAKLLSRFWQVTTPVLVYPINLSLMEDMGAPGLANFETRVGELYHAAMY